jgi:hypothetical protein
MEKENRGSTRIYADQAGATGSRGGEVWLPQRAQKTQKTQRKSNEYAF